MNTQNSRLKVLLVEDNPGDFRLIDEMLKEVSSAKFELVWANRLSAGLEHLKQGIFDVLLLDLGLPDSQGFDTFEKIHDQASQIPIIVLTGLADDGLADDGLAMRAVREGAQDYLVKGRIDSNLLVHSIHYATERKRAEEEIKTKNEELAAANEELVAANEEFEAANEELITTNQELQRTEEALRESEARYKRLIDSVTDYIYTVRVQDGRAVETTHGPGCVAVTGYTSGEYQADPYLWYRMVYAQDRDAVAEQAARVIAGETTAPLEHRIVHRDGSIRWVRNTSVPHYDEHRRLVAYDGLITNITEHKRTEEALRESEERYRTQFDEALDGICLADAETGIIIDCNQELSALVGRDKAEMIGQPQTILHPPADDNTAFSPTFKQHLTNKEGQVLGTQVVTKTGEIREVEIKAHYLDLQGRKMLQGIFRDITEHKRAEEALRDSEERYRTLVASATDMIFIAQDGILRFPNPATLTITGYSEEELSTLPFANIIHPEDREMVIEKHTRRLKGEEVPNTYSFRILTKGEEVLWVQLNAVLVTWEGRPGVLCSLRDITPQKRLEEQYLHAQKMEAVGTLAGGVAHDFNNLLQAVLGNAQMFLMEKKADDPGYQQMVAIKQAAQRGAELTQRLLTFSRKVQSKPKVLNLNQEVMEVEKLLRRTISKMIEVELRLSGNPWAISADPVQMGQVIMNLALNARDAMPEGGRLVIGTQNMTLDEEFCRSHVGLRAGSYVLLSVSDTGQGMGKEVLQHLFEPFFTTKAVGRGTGLGLAMVYGIVKGHEGYIECESELGKGSIFKIYFLAVEQAVEEEEAEEEERPRGGRETILLVDDEESLRDLAKEILSTFGYTVITASDGEGALEIYRREKDKIHLIILDIIMPGIGGMRCLEGLQSIDPEVRVVIATGYTPEGEAGGYISKPYDMRELLRVVREALDK